VSSERDVGKRDCGLLEEGVKKCERVGWREGRVYVDVLVHYEG